MNATYARCCNVPDTVIRSKSKNFSVRQLPITPASMTMLCAVNALQTFNEILLWWFSANHTGWWWHSFGSFRRKNTGYRQFSCVLRKYCLYHSFHIISFFHSNSICWKLITPGTFQTGDSFQIVDRFKVVISMLHCFCAPITAFHLSTHNIADGWKLSGLCEMDFGNLSQIMDIPWDDKYTSRIRRNSVWCDK